MVTPAGRHITSPEAVFRDGEHHYRQLLSRMPTAVYTCDAAGVITYFNEQAAEIWGRAPQIGDVSDRFCGSEQLILPDGTRLPHEECPMAVALREGKTFRNQEINIRRPDGSLVTVLVNVDPIRTGEGDLIGAINAFHDVTAIKQAEAAVRRREGWLAGQREALELAMSDAPLQESLAILVRTAIEEMGQDARAAFYLTNDAGTALHHVVGMPGDYAETVDGFGVGPDSLACGLATHTGKAILTSDVRNDPNWKEWLWMAEKFDYRACWSFPIHSAKKFVGTMAVYSRHVREASEHDIQICSMLSHTASAIISKYSESLVRKQAEKALRESQEQMRRSAETFAALVEQSPLGIYAVDADFRVRHASAGSAPMFQNVQPIIGRDAVEVMHTIWPDPFASQLIGIFRHTLETGEPYVSPGLTEKRKDLGSIESYEWQINRVVLADGRFGVVCYFFDTTRLQHALRELRDSEERFRMLADNMAQLAWICNELGNVTWYNKRWIEYTGLTFEEMKDWGWTVCHHPDHIDRVVESVTRSRETGEIWEDTFPLRGKDGKYRWFLSRAYPIRDGQGDIVRWFGTNTDVTVQREAEQRAHDASRAKDKFLAVLSHELRTPLTPVLMTAAMLQRREDLAPEVRDGLGLIHRNVELQSRLIDDLLDLSRIASGKLRLRLDVLDINELVGRACDICRLNLHERGIRLFCDLQSDTLEVTGDAGRLQQVFWNLLNNATKFTPEGGEIFVRSEKISESGADKIRVTVRDTGIGIGRDDLAHIFDAFEQAAHGLDDAMTARKFGGMGLGLAICRALIEQHNGSIRARSDGTNEGSTFTVELPALPPHAEPQAGFRLVAPTKLPPMRLLIVEDHPDTAKTLAALLGMGGHTVSIAHNGTDALKLVTEQIFDIMISDLGLPDMTGYHLLRQIKQQRSIKAIAMSGYGMEEDINKSKQAGFVDHIVKPATIDQLEQVLYRVALQ